jgi:hypothetical protein
MQDARGVELPSGSVPGVPKVFDMVSADRSVVGDAKCSSLVQRERLPPATCMEIAGHVWLLEKTGAARQFLVFGNRREVPQSWRHKHGRLVGNVEFYFPDDGGRLERLAQVFPGRASALCRGGTGMDAIIIPCTQEQIWDTRSDASPVAARNAYTIPVFARWRAHAAQRKPVVCPQHKYGLVTPDTLIERCNVPISAAVRDALFRQRLRDQGAALNLRQ